MIIIPALTGCCLIPGRWRTASIKVNINILAVSAFGGNNAYEIDRDKLFSFHLGGL